MIARRLVIALALAACTVEVEDDPPDEAPPASGPAQRSCEDIVDCLEHERETGTQTCARLDEQDALEDAEHAIEICDYARDSPDPREFDRCTTFEC